MTSTRLLALTALLGLSASAFCQVPDLLNALDAGGRSMGQGGALNVTNADTLSSYYNPAGLGYIEGRALGITQRNLPASKTTMTGAFSDPKLDSKGSKGKSAFTHFGYAMPMGEIRKGTPGTLGISYTIGGSIDDERTATNLTSGSLFVRNYEESIKAKSEFLTISYGRTTASQNASFGVGLVFLTQKVENRVSGALFDNTNTQVSTISANNSDSGTGFGLIVGYQAIPKSNPNLSYGVSYRTEINLSGNKDTKDLYDKVPARLAAGVALRRDGIRGEDFAVIGAQFQHFFGTQSSQIFDRGDQTTFGFGIEYNHFRRGLRIPVRLGYMAVPSGGQGYGSRNAFTYGIGVAVDSGKYSLDINGAAPQGSGTDLSIGFTYRFGN